MYSSGCQVIDITTFAPVVVMFITTMGKNASSRRAVAVNRAANAGGWSAARQRVVIQAAGELFLRHGYAGVSLEMIVTRTGGSLRDVYREFGNKKTLFRRVITEICGEVLTPMRAVATAMSETNNAVEDSLIALGEAYVTNLLSPRVVALDRLIISEAKRFPELPALFMAAGPAHAYADVARLLEVWFARDGVKLADPGTAARLYLHTIQGHLHLRALTGGRVSVTEITHIVRSGVRIFAAGVRYLENQNGAVPRR